MNELNFFYTNATSLRNKWEEFNSLISFTEFSHVIMLSETWFNTDSLTMIRNYTLYSKNRDQIIGGGVAIHIRNDLVSSEVDILSPNICISEQVWCHVTVGRNVAAYTGHHSRAGRLATI